MTHLISIVKYLLAAFCILGLWGCWPESSKTGKNVDAHGLSTHGRSPIPEPDKSRIFNRLASNKPHKFDLNNPEVESSAKQQQKTTLKSMPDSFKLDLPAAPTPPQVPTPLDVKGYNPASHVGPDVQGDWPKPVVVVLHGNFDRPEWECDIWKDVAGFRGWILCPRGVRTPWASRAEDRWTYRGASAVQREIDASLEALEKRYPGRVTRKNMVLVGFSLGGILAPSLVESRPRSYPYLFLVEGGVKKIDRHRLKGLKKAGVLGIGFGMSALGRRNAAKKLKQEMKRLEMKYSFADMKGAGHGYRDDFDVSGKIALKEILDFTDQNPDGGVSQ